MDARYSRRFALVTMLLVALNAAVFVWELTLPSDDGGARILSNCLRPDTLFGAMRDLDAQAFYAQAPKVFTSMFMHASVSMLCGNMVFLVLTGLAYERLRGGVWLACLYFSGAIVGVLVDGLVNSHPGIPVMGSGCGVAAVFGAYTLTLLLGRVQLEKRNKIIVLVLIAVWALLEAVGLYREATGLPHDSIAYIAVVSGFVFGLVAEGVRGSLAATPDLKP